jgi:hypothetical protein
MGDVLTVVLPLLAVGVAFIVALGLQQRIPTMLKVYRIHAIAYPVVTVLGLATAALMGLSSSFDWWVNDAAVYLTLQFGISGVVVCTALAPVVWWWEHQSDLAKARRVGRIAINSVALLP